MSKKYWDDLTEGTVLWGDEVTVDQNEMLEYAKKNDPLPFHIDESAAASTHFGGLIASGGYTITLWYRSSIPVIGSIALLAGHDFHINLPTPVRPGNVLRTRFDIVERRKSSKPLKGHVTSRQRLLNQDDVEVLICEAKWIVATRAE